MLIKPCFIEIVEHSFHKVDTVGLGSGGAVGFPLSLPFTVCDVDAHR